MEVHNPNTQYPDRKKRLEISELLRIRKSLEFRPAKLGDEFSGAWKTYWFHLVFDVKKWRAGFQEKLRYFQEENFEIVMIWDSESEAQMYDTEGNLISAFYGSKGEDRRAEFVFPKAFWTHDYFECYVELACTKMFGNGSNNGWGPIGPTPTDNNAKFSLQICHIALRDSLLYKLVTAFQIITDFATKVKGFENNPHSLKALFLGNEIMNLVDSDDRSTWKEAHKKAKEFLATPSGPHAHQITAVGHCHIDTCWLWPYSETERKCGRSWSSQIQLLERYPFYRFACSQAQQFDWVKKLYPDVYKKVQALSKEDRFIPVGGTWVEMDCNIPSGESLVRQFLYGQSFFKKEFGRYCQEFWLPDTFGYSSQLPQIMRLSGISYFLTQKLSWCQFNSFPHHSFYWQGIDGNKSQVLTHFPPTDTYNAQCTASEIQFHQRNYKEHERSNRSLMLFGNGDGGGGPTYQMLENLSYLQDCSGLPKIDSSTPQIFFEKLQKESQDLAVWVGELYFELHRGTYTSQAKHKLGNRKSEILLGGLEKLASLTWINCRPSYKYPFEEIETMWKLLLLNQFHDALPGSSINECYKDSAEHFEEIEQGVARLFTEICQVWSTFEKRRKTECEPAVFYNPHNWARTELVELEASDSIIQNKETQSQRLEGNNKALVLVEAEGFSFGRVVGPRNQVSISSSEQLGVTTLENSFLRAGFDTASGILCTLVEKSSGREMVCEGGNQFVLFEDIPNYWDAWDVDIWHLEKRRLVVATGPLRITENGPFRVAFEISFRTTNGSTIVETVSLAGHQPRLDFACTVDWKESHQFLKVEFPTTISAARATYETQFGHIERPTHFNTSWETAKFEVPVHKFAVLEEFGAGVAILNDCKYGFSTRGSLLTLSLLRSPKNPDPECDMGTHRFRFAILPFCTSDQNKYTSFQGAGIVEAGFDFNHSLLDIRPPSNEWRCTGPLVKVTGAAGLVVDTVKMAEDRSGLVVRLYEAYGRSTRFGLELGVAFNEVVAVDLLERPLQAQPSSLNNLSTTAFQIHTFKFTF